MMSCSEKLQTPTSSHAVVGVAIRTKTTHPCLSNGLGCTGYHADTTPTPCSRHPRPQTRYCRELASVVR
eukprot:755040-Hanusia_phi.AAC.1